MAEIDQREAAIRCGHVAERPADRVVVVIGCRLAQLRPVRETRRATTLAAAKGCRGNC